MKRLLFTTAAFFLFLFPIQSGSGQKHYGEKFVFENIEKRGDEFIKQIDKFGAQMDEALSYTTDIKLKPDAVHPNGLNLEYKSWKKSSFDKLMKGDQFKKQLKNYIREGDFEYIIDRNKLLKDGVLDPDKFVKGEFQKVFRENAKELFEQNRDLFEKIKISEGQFINSSKQLERVAADNKLFNQLIGDIYIKVE